jgi:putative ABC transport system substrate-binding protein
MKTLTRRRVMHGLALGAASPSAWMGQLARAQEPIRRVGFLGLRPVAEVSQHLAALRDGLRDLGYVEGENYVLEVRAADNDPGRYPALVSELTKAQVELIVTANLPAAAAIHATNPRMRIVIGQGPDILGTKLAESHNRPGGVATGIEELVPGMTDKRLRLLKEAVSTISNIAILSPAPTPGGHTLQYTEADQTAEVIGLTLRSYRVTRTSEFETVFDTIMSDGVHALVVFVGVLPRPIEKQIVQLATKHRLPAIYPDLDFIEAGGLLVHGQHKPARFRLAAAYVDKILRGAQPGDLPITYDTNPFRLVINTTAAQALGLALPHSLLSQADQILK